MALKVRRRGQSHNDGHSDDCEIPRQPQVDSL